jgi:hypothetical protein
LPMPKPFSRGLYSRDCRERAIEPIEVGASWGRQALWN